MPRPPVSFLPLLLSLAALPPPARAGALLWVRSSGPFGGASLAVDAATGMPAQLSTAFGLSTPLSALSWAGEPGAPAAPPLSVAAAQCGAAVCVTRSLAVRGQTPPGGCCADYTATATDVFAPHPSGAIAWTFSIADAASAPAAGWRTSLRTDVAFGFAASNASDAAFWLPRGGMAPDSALPWAEVLAMSTGGSAPLAAMLGLGYIYEAPVAAGREVAPVAVSVAASLSARAGVALFHAPDDALVAATLDVGAAGANFTRLYNRLGAGAAPLVAGQGAVFTTFLVPLNGTDWRPAPPSRHIFFRARCCRRRWRQR